MVPVTAQSTTPRCNAGTTSPKAMLMVVPPIAWMKSAIVLLNTRILRPLRSWIPATSSRHQKTWGGLVPSASSLALNFACIARSIAGFQALHTLRAVPMSRARPARSQPSKVGSSPAILLMSLTPNWVVPSLMSLRTWKSLIPMRS